jgi:hypothetical protein
MASTNDTKVISLRLDPADHAEASVAADLLGENFTEFARQAIRDRIAAVKADPTMREKAAEVARQLDAEIAARRSAVASFIAPEIP